MLGGLSEKERAAMEAKGEAERNRAVDGADVVREKLIKQLVSPEDPEAIYELTEILGKGSHGVVYKAINRINGSVVAMKRMPNILHSEDLTNNLTEIKILKELNSPYCIEFYDSYYKGGDLWIAMEFFDAGSIGDLLTVRRKPLTESQIQLIVYQVLKGLCYLHNLNLIHRDVKAGNVLLNKKGRVKLADFGISSFLHPDETRKQTQIGSPFWMSPELIFGDGYTHKTDVWSLGITILEMAEVDHPHFQQNPLTAVFQIVSDDPPRLSKPNQWSPTFQHFLSLCLRKDVSARPSCRDLLSHPFLSMRSHRASAFIFGVPTGNDAETAFLLGKKDSPRGSVDDSTQQQQQYYQILQGGGTPTGSNQSSQSVPQQSPSASGSVGSQAGTSSPSLGDGLDNGNENEEEMLKKSNQQLASEYLLALKNYGGNNAALRGQTDELNEEMIIRVYLQDKSYRSVLLRKGDTASVVVQKLRQKMGGNRDSFGRFSLYKFQYENERVVDEKADLFEMLRQARNAPLVWIFKEVPDAEAFGELANVLPLLEPSHGGISLAKNRQAIDEFIMLLVRPHLSVISAICAVSQGDLKRQERLVGALIKFFGHHQCLVPLFEKLASVEVARTVSVNNLFIGGSFTAKLASAYGKIIGKDYLKLVLSPALRQVFMLSEPLELDPTRVEQSQIPNNLMQLQRLSQLILSTIYENVEAIPINFRIVCRKLHHIVVTCFRALESQSHVLLRSFMFVKFICPAIVTPLAFGIIDSPPSTRGVNRTLVLLSKTIQALVTGVRFGKREAYMSTMNLFIDENSHSTDMQHLFDAILDIEEKSAATRPKTLSIRTVDPAPPPRTRSVSSYNTSGSSISREPGSPPPTRATSDTKSGSSSPSSGASSSSSTPTREKSSGSRIFARVLPGARRSTRSQSIGAARTSRSITGSTVEEALRSEGEASDNNKGKGKDGGDEGTVHFVGTSGSGEIERPSSSYTRAVRSLTTLANEDDIFDYVESKDFELTDEELEEALVVFHEYLNDTEKFRLVGEAMNILPSPPWSLDRQGHPVGTNGIYEVSSLTEG